MNKCEFLKQSAWVVGGVSVIPEVFLSACKTEPKKEEKMKTNPFAIPTFELPKIPYGYNAFPAIRVSAKVLIHVSIIPKPYLFIAVNSTFPVFVSIFTMPTSCIKDDGKIGNYAREALLSLWEYKRS